jgi:hypothetical protein
MSRQEILDRLLENQRLFDLTSGEEMPRYAYVSADIIAVVEPPFEDSLQGERLGRFRAWLDGFMDGAYLSVSEDPRGKPPETQLARVEEVEGEFWSIRVTEPKDTAGIRAFGAFHALNEFIALTWAMREDIGADFDEAVGEAQERWEDFFGQVRPHSGDNLNEYLTNFYETS